MVESLKFQCDIMVLFLEHDLIPRRAWHMVEGLQRMRKLEPSHQPEVQGPMVPRTHSQTRSQPLRRGRGMASHSVTQGSHDLCHTTPGKSNTDTRSHITKSGFTSQSTHIILILSRKSHIDSLVIVLVILLSTIAIWKGLSRTRIQDTFGVDETVIFMGRSGIECVRLGVTINAVGLVDPSGSVTGERAVQFEEGVFTQDGVT